MKYNIYKYLPIPIITCILSLIALIYLSFSGYNYYKKPYTDFLVDLQNDEVKKVNIGDNSILTITLADGTKYKTDNPNTNDFRENLLLNNIEITDEVSSSLNQTIASTILLISIIAIVLMSINKQKLGGSSHTELNLIDFSQKNKDQFNFTSVAGNEEAKESLNDIVDFLKNPDKYTAYGAKMPRGVILYGDPGTGKTLLAKAVAGEANVPFYALSGSDFVQMYVGVGAARIRNLFKKARSHGRAVIFIDEIDAIGKTRASGKSAAGGNDERDQTLNALLTEMSGFSESEGIVVIAATNRLDTLDSALLRPGRFDRHVQVSLPDLKAREKIIKLYLKNKPHKNIDIISLAKKTAYFSGAKLESFINEAAILAAKENKEYITEEDFEKAYSIILAGADKKERDHLKEADRILTSYHEAGHALVSLIKIPDDTVSKITIIPTTKGAGGYTLTIPEDKNYQRIDYLSNKIMVLLAGRAAEELVFGKEKISSGAEGDLEQVTNIIIAMLTKYGMGKSLGLLSLTNLSSLSSSYGQPIVEEAKDTITCLYEKTFYLLKDNYDILNKLASELLEKETLTEKDVEKFITMLHK